MLTSNTELKEKLKELQQASQALEVSVMAKKLLSLVVAVDNVWCLSFRRNYLRKSSALKSNRVKLQSSERNSHHCKYVEEMHYPRVMWCSTVPSMNKCL